MANLGQTTEALANAAMDRVRPMAQRLSLRVALLLIALFLCIGALFCLCWVLIMALSTVIDPVWAGLIAALSLLGLAVLFVVIAWTMRLSPQRPPRTSDRVPPATIVEGLASDAGQAIGTGIRENPKTAAMVALVAGIAVGASPELRRRLAATTKNRDES